MADLDDDVPLHAPAIATVAGLVGLAAGLLTAATGLQLLAFVYLWGWLQLVPWLFLALGAATLGAAGLTTRGGPRAVTALALLAAAGALFGGVWMIYALYNGFFSLLSLLSTLAAGFTALLAPVAVGPCRAVAERRAKLLA